MMRLSQQGAGAAMRLHQARHRAIDLRRGKKLGRNQRLVEWPKPVSQPKGSQLSAEEWDQLPDSLAVRLIWFGYRDRHGRKRRMVLATTLLDAELHPWEELAAIYASRWDIELRLRDLKTTLGLEMIHAKTPEMARKALKIGVIAANLVRATAQSVAVAFEVALDALSFKATLDTILSHAPLFAGTLGKPRTHRSLWRMMRQSIVSRLLKKRPGRHEPRALKRRLKPFSLLTASRAIFVETSHRGKARSLA